MNELLDDLTPHAQRALVIAREEAHRFNCSFVGTEHLLLGLIKLDQGVAVNVLKKLGLDLKIVLEKVEERVTPGSDQKMLVDLLFTLRVRKILSSAYKQATELNHNHVGTEHILLGILLEGYGIAAEILREFGITDLNTVRNMVLLELDPDYRVPEAEVAGVTKSTDGDKDKSGSMVRGPTVQILGGLFVDDIVGYHQNPLEFVPGFIPQEQRKWLFAYVELLLAAGFSFSGLELSVFAKMVSDDVTVEELSIMCRMIRSRQSECPERELQDLFNKTTPDSLEEARFGRLLQAFTRVHPRKLGPQRDWLKDVKFAKNPPPATPESAELPLAEESPLPPANPPVS